MGAEIKELALKKTKEINIAYEYFIEKYQIKGKTLVL